MPNDPNPSNLGAGANLAPIEDPDPVTIAPDLAQGETGADDNCDGLRPSPSTAAAKPRVCFDCGRFFWGTGYYARADAIACCPGCDHQDVERDNDCDSAAPDGDGHADNDCDDVAPCWCGETDPLFDDEGLDATCDGSGTLICHCGGDLCVCHHYGETECPGCEHCAELEGDDDGPFEDGDESGPGWCDRCSPDPCDCDDEED